MVASKQATVSERRALLTDREREIIAGDADVADSYRYQTISRVRARFDRLESDLQALERHGELADEFRGIVCRADADQTPPASARESAGESGEESAGGASTSQPPGEGESRSTPPHDAERDDPIGDVLREWETDTEADASTARAQTRRAAEWLRADGGRHTKTDFVDALADGSELGDRSWWERAVQPGLRRLADHSLVEYRGGYHDYRWSGDAR
jgi:hypothetical protein